MTGDLRSDCQHKGKKRQRSQEELAPLCLPTGDLSSEHREDRTDLLTCGAESAWPATLNRNKTDRFKRHGMPCQPSTWPGRERNFPKPVTAELTSVSPLLSRCGCR